MASRKSDFTRKTVSVLKDADVDISNKAEEEIQWAEGLRALILKYPIGGGASNETIEKELKARSLSISFSTFKRKRRTFEKEHLKKNKLFRVSFLNLHLVGGVKDEYR